MNLLISYLIIPLWIALHPLHLSVTNLDYHSAKERCFLTVKVFSDDFAEIIRLREGEGVLQGRDTLSLKDHPVITPYLKDNLQIRLDGTLYSFERWSLDSIRNNFEATWLYFSLDYNNLFNEVSIQNTILFDYFADQKNLMIIARDTKERAFQFNHKKPVITLRF